MYHQTFRYLNPPIGYYSSDDDAILFYTNQNDRFVFLKGEFDTIGYGLWELCLKKKTIPYIQLLLEWNECKGFNDIEGKESELEVKETLEAFIMLKEEKVEFLESLEHNHDFYCPKEEDLEEFIKFLSDIKENNKKLYIVESWRGNENTLLA